MGGRPKPRVIRHSANGNSRHPFTEPPRPAHPEQLGEFGRAYWDRLAPILVERRQLDAGNLELLETLCHTWQRYMTLRGWLDANQDRLTFRSATGFERPAPQLAMMAGVLRELRQLWKLFGLCPKAADKENAAALSLREAAALKTIGDEESAPPEILAKIRAARRA